MRFLTTVLLFLQTKLNEEIDLVTFHYNKLHAQHVEVLKELKEAERRIESSVSSVRLNFWNF